MSAKDLITLARAKQGILAVVDSTYDTQLGVLVTSVSDAIEKHCRRSFYSRTLDELYDGARERLYLREYPIQSVTWLRYGPEVVLQIRNTLPATNQRATVQVTSTGLTLTRVASGVVTTDTSVTFVTYPTLQAMATAINALGSGWIAQVTGSSTGDYGLWPSADLYVAPYLGDGLASMGALNCRDTPAGLRMHVGELSDIAFHPTGYLYWPLGLQWPAGLGNYSGEGTEAFRCSPGYWRCKYTAGYTTIPEAVQEAAAEWVAQVWYLSQRNPDLSNTLATTGAASGYFAQLLSSDPPRGVRTLLAPFKRHTAAPSQGGY